MTTSAMESSCTPISVVVFVMRAIRPSSMSKRTRPADRFGSVVKIDGGLHQICVSAGADELKTAHGGHHGIETHADIRRSENGRNQINAFSQSAPFRVFGFSILQMRGTRHRIFR